MKITLFFHPFFRLPAYSQFIIIATLIAVMGGKEVLGYRVSGLTWFVPMVFSLVYIIPRLRKVSFPWKMWLPWCILLFYWLVMTDFPALQRTAQLLCPLVVGVCASTIPVRHDMLENLLRTCRGMAVLLTILSVTKSGLQYMGSIPYNQGLAAELMPALLLSGVFAASYSFGFMKDIGLWVVLLALNVFGLFRSGIAVAGLTLPFTFAPLGMRKRIVFILAAIPVALGVFYLPTLQREMFFSGQGTVRDIFTKDFADSGRKSMWEAVKYGIQQEPVWGHGAGACEDFVLKFTGSLKYPHNDWLLTTYDYGYFGSILLGLTLLAALVNALREARRAVGVELKILFYSGAFSFVILALIMLTDNIMIYASFFGNLQFMLLGLAYAALRSQQRQKWFAATRIRM